MKVHLAAQDTDNVLRLLRMLPPRERLRVLAKALPELEDELPATPASPAFFWGAISRPWPSGKAFNLSQTLTVCWAAGRRTSP